MMNEIKGWKLGELMKIVVSMEGQDSKKLRTVIREYGIRAPEDLLFLTPEQYKKIRGAGKSFFLNMKLALLGNGTPYDLETPEEIKKQITEGQSRQDALTKMRFEILKRDNFACQYCGRRPGNGEDVILHIDHIYPASKGGEWSEDNLITSCRECNSGKSDILLEEINR
jgi:hypothetical protein